MIQIPLFFDSVSAGFPSPADDFLESSLNIHEHLVKNPCSTFFLRVAGESMSGAGIHPDDILVVDKSRSPQNNDIVIAVLESAFTVKYFRRFDQKTILLESANPAYPNIKVSEIEIWGVVTGVVRKVK